MAATHQSALTRTIFHVDMDAFFVSVEELYDPSLKGKAVVVGGQRDERGVVSAASYEARKFGVHSAMPLRTAAKMCPHAIFVDGHPERYREYSEKVYKVLTTFSPQVEMASVDEAYLDMTCTARLHGPPLKAAHALHQRMKDETRLNCSVGIGSSRLIAKVSSAQAKPNGVLWIIPGEEPKFLAPLDVRAIPGVTSVGLTTVIPSEQSGARSWIVLAFPALEDAGPAVRDRAGVRGRGVQGEMAQHFSRRRPHGEGRQSLRRTGSVGGNSKWNVVRLPV